MDALILFEFHVPGDWGYGWPQNVEAAVISDLETHEPSCMVVPASSCPALGARGSGCELCTLLNDGPIRPGSDLCWRTNRSEARRAT
ncbi:hypothetical protein CEXT_506061 [Caerostris extrusa]|uniref:Uncharacterized protein n=1 Tax=Caerostris extrusa TaxID=172846 RepID=A0AAV4XE71_CAEEX|nr:hypothetical protein CEXT_506061 [Caerostris extrusa]